MTLSFAARRLVVLSGSQVAAMLAASAGGLAGWLIAARMMPPAEIGQAAAIVSLGTLVSGVAAAGLGQYLLAALPQHPALDRRRLMVRVVGWALLATAIAAVFAGMVAYDSVIDMVLLVLLALSITATTTQDSVYLCAGSARDVIAKALAISALKPPLMLIAGATSGLLDGSSLLVLAVISPGLALGLAWQMVRAPRALDRIVEPAAPADIRHRHLLTVGYWYALSNSLVSLGIPALATNVLPPAVTALFYVAWTIASVLASVAAAVANVVVARAKRVGETLRAIPIILAHGGFSLAVAAGVLLFAPLILGAFGTYYQAAIPILAVLLLGNVFSGTGAVLIGFARRTASSMDVTVAISTWVVGGFGVPAVAAGAGAIDIAVAYLIGSTAAFGLVLVVLRPRTLPNAGDVTA